MLNKNTIKRIQQITWGSIDFAKLQILNWVRFPDFKKIIFFLLKLLKFTTILVALTYYDK